MLSLEDSTTYQEISQKGYQQGLAQGLAAGAAQRMLLIMGRKRLGTLPDAVETTLRSIVDIDRLGRMAERIFDAAGWDDLLATP